MPLPAVAMCASATHSVLVLCLMSDCVGAALLCATGVAGVGAALLCATGVAATALFACLLALGAVDTAGSDSLSLLLLLSLPLLLSLLLQLLPVASCVFVALCC